MHVRGKQILTAVLAAAIALTGCASAQQAPARSEPVAEGRTSYPLTIENCGEQVRFEKAPERVLLLESAPVTILDGLGVLDTVIAKAGSFPADYFDPDLAARIDQIDSLSDEIDASGHLMISAEAVVAQQPDLVFGLPDGLTRAGLRDGGAETLIQPIYCPQATDTSFETLFDQVRLYGRIFDRNAEAEALVGELRDRVTKVEQATQGLADERTAAVLYPSVGGGPLYAYGRASMAQPQLEAAGFRNVFDDESARVFEVNIEELIARDPDVIIVLYQGSAAGIVETVETLPGAQDMDAFRNGDVYAQLFNFTEPPSLLSVTGLERIVARFGTGS